MQSYNYDVVVIGAGPAGEGAALNAAQNHLRVAVIDSRVEVGGNCTHLGTIPSKALRYTVWQVMRYSKNPLFRNLGDRHDFLFSDIIKSAKNVIEKQVLSRSAEYAYNRIDVFCGDAKFVAQDLLEVANSNGDITRFHANNVVIATGSRPYRPSNVDFNHPRIYDSDTILLSKHTPKRLIIYGAGVIGCEYASIFGGLGVQVDLINNREQLLSFLDAEISDALSYHLRNNNVLIRNQEEYAQITANDKGVTLELKSGKKLKSDALLWCNGRTGNTANLNLEAVGIAANKRGQIEVNRYYQTCTANIYAAGDVIGWPSLASASYDQGRSAAGNIANPKSWHFVNDVPTGIYTIPEISSIGKTESELTAENIPYEVGKALFKDTARAQISNETAGMLKILFHRENLSILGVHCFGFQAAEIIHIGQAIMNQTGSANNLRYFIDTTFNYPTMAEAYRTAAFDGLSRIA